MGFTEDELAIIGIYRQDSRKKTIEQITASAPHVEDPEMLKLMGWTAADLEVASDREFSKALEQLPDYSGEPGVVITVGSIKELKELINRMSDDEMISITLDTPERVTK